MKPGESARKALAYRPDIDGLRAICVAAVVLFHAGVPGFAGGYVGVDVFFVISGYLITLLLVGSSAEPLGRQLTNFYIRRSRRIAPALIVVLIAATAAAVVILLPSDLVGFGKYLALTSALLGNIAAWTDGGYFAPGGPHTPLLHLWSIAVEEQFYVAYPLVLLFGSRWFPRQLCRLLIAAAGASLAICVWASNHSPAANFYLAPTRAWELLLGALIALRAVPWLRSRFANEVLAGTSLGVLVLVICTYGPAMKYPGLYTIPPALAAAVLIATGRQDSTVTGRLLSLRPLVFTGLISYSLYLWHLPVFAFFTYYNIREPDALQLGLMIASIYLIAVMSWMVVERPIRRRTLLGGDRPFVLLAVGAMLAIGATGVLLWRSDGIPERFSPEVRLLLDTGTIDAGTIENIRRCMTLPLRKIESGELCSYGPSDPDLAKVVVWGDSHALALLPVYVELAASHHVQLYFSAHSACRPLMDMASGDWSTRAPCSNFNAAMIRAIRRLDPELLVLNAYWSYAGPSAPSLPDLATPADESSLIHGLEDTLKQVGRGNTSVCVVLDVPTLKYSAPYALAMARRKHIGTEFLTVSRADAIEKVHNFEREMRALQQRGIVKIADPKDMLCSTDTCDVQIDGRSLYRDSNHLSVTGARFVSDTLEPCFQDIR